jgi:hypothetical protein
MSQQIPKIVSIDAICRYCKNCNLKQFEATKKGFCSSEWCMGPGGKVPFEMFTPRRSL